MELNCIRKPIIFFFLSSILLNLVLENVFKLLWDDKCINGERLQHLRSVDDVVSPSTGSRTKTGKITKRKREERGKTTNNIKSKYKI